MKKSIRHLAFVILLGAFVLSSGCVNVSKLPPIDAAAFDYSRNDPFGGTKVHAENVRVNDSTTGSLAADVVQWDTTYPAWGVHVKVVGYRQSGTAPTAAANPVVPAKP